MIYIIYISIYVSHAIDNVIAATVLLHNKKPTGL